LEGNYKIKNIAINCGFDLCGIAKISNVDEFAVNALKKWITKNQNCDLKYVENSFDKRINPTEILANGKSIIVLGLNYFNIKNLQTQNLHKYKISLYALGKNYHNHIQKKLKLFEKKLILEYPNIEIKKFVDSAPIMEKYWAMQAGLGFIGKNSLLIEPNKGSWFFLSGVVIDKEFEPDIPFSENLCGNCKICIEACPTNAIEEDRVLNAKKCISYLTIEDKSSFEKLNQSWQEWIWGCDICQLVCPYNKSASNSNTKDFDILPQINDVMKLKLWENKTDFDNKFSGTSIKRGGYERIIRNIKHVKL